MGLVDLQVFLNISVSVILQISLISRASMAFSKILIVFFFRITFRSSESMVYKQQLKYPPHNISVSSLASTELI